jgi:peroxiredoxin
MQYKSEEFELTDDYIDIGYMAENFVAQDSIGNTKEVKRSHSDKAMTLLISFPNEDEIFINEALKLDAFMKNIQVPIYCYFVFAKQLKQKAILNNRLEKFELIIDSEEEFGNMYGTKIVSGSLNDMLTKSLFLISKDGAIFYLELPEELEKPLNLERLQVELNKAYVSYTGTGCH